MKKVAIVGVEGSGKTVMLAGLGELYSHPDRHGFFLSPKNFNTASYVADKIIRMRSGQWPVASAEDALQGLDWTLRRKSGSSRRPEDICEVSCLDFAGEVYRSAFGINSDNSSKAETKEVASLKRYIRNATDLIILINLRDIINKGLSEKRVQESMWTTNAILSFAMDTSDGREEPRAVIVLSQADSYDNTIRECGGAKGVLARYLPHVANNYDWVDVIAVSAVDKTQMDKEGNIVPAQDFQPSGLKKIMNWILIKEDDEETRKIDWSGISRAFVLRFRKFVEACRSKAGVIALGGLAILVAIGGGGWWLYQNIGLNPGDAKTIALPGGAEMKFHWCPHGEFIMGSDNGDSAEKPVHRVKLTKGFWMGETEVTQGQWKSVMRNKPSRFEGDDLPVECVSWKDCIKFIEKVKLQTGLNLSLPTEAQWEYACRAGTTDDYAGNLDDMAWYGANSDNKTHPVRKKAANKWGLHDMHGNVCEWCQDWYGDYSSTDVADPTGPTLGSSRVLRGGRWDFCKESCRSVSRFWRDPDHQDINIGFRLVCSEAPRGK